MAQRSHLRAEEARKRRYAGGVQAAAARYGIRLQTYEFEEGELLGAIDRLLADDGLRERTRAIASRVQAAPGTVKAAALIEHLAREGAPVVG